MVARGCSGDASEPMLTHRRPGDLAPTFVQFPLGKLRVQVRHVGTKRGAAVAVGALLLLSALVTLIFRTGGRIFPDPQDVTGPASHSEATLLLAKTAGLSNPDEAEVLLEALQTGTLDYGAVSSALEEDAARKKARIKAEIEEEASRKAAEEKAAAEKAAAAKAAAEKAAAAKAAAEKAAAEKAAAEKAAAEKAVAEMAAAKKTAADKAAAVRAHLKMRKADPQSLIGFSYENDDDYYDEDDLFADEFNDEIGDGDSLAFSRRGQERSVNFIDSRGGRRSTTKKENHRVPITQSSRARLNPNKSPNVFEEKEGPERRDDDDEEYYGNKQRGKSSPLRTDQKPSHAPLFRPQAATGDRRQAPDGGAGRQRGGVWREGGGGGGVPLRFP